jgi:hypothetical protein
MQEPGAADILTLSTAAQGERRQGVGVAAKG